jgi:hypothetical protein
MSLLAVSTAGAILAILGLVVGLVVLGVVIILLQGVLSPAREIAQQAKQAPDVAPFLTNGVQGVDELSRTRQLTNQVPPLALAYLDKVQRGAPAPGAPAPAPGGAPAGQGPAPSEPPHYGSVHRGGISGGKR